LTFSEVMDATRLSQAVTNPIKKVCLPVRRLALYC
jgi:hypothetical protein